MIPPNQSPTATAQLEPHGPIAHCQGRSRVYIGRTEQALQHLIHKREIVVVRKGRRVHVDSSDLDRWIEANKV